MKVSSAIVASVVVIVIAITQPGHAQILGTGVMPVTEIGPNLYQSTITAAESVAQTFHMALEITPLDEIIIGGELANDLAILGEVICNAELVWWDFQSLESQITYLFGLDNVPDTRDGLDQRIIEIRQYYYQTLNQAMRAQTLMMTALRTIEHVRRLVESVRALVGNMQGNQTLVQTNVTMSKTLAVMETQQATWQRADTVQRLSEGVIQASMEKIAAKRLADHPRY